MVGEEFYHDIRRWRERTEGGEGEARDLLLSYNQVWISRRRNSIFCGGAGWG